MPSITCKYEDLPAGHIRVVATCEIMNHHTELLARTEAVCSSMEAKYRFRGSRGRQCPVCGSPTVLTAKKEYGGGFYCAKTQGGCGESFKNGTKEAKALADIQPERLENDSPADQWNTVSKMAQKRALMSAVLMATGASALFTTEDPEPPERPAPKAPQLATADQLADMNRIGTLVYGPDKWPAMRQKWIDQNCTKGALPEELTAYQVEGIINGMEALSKAHTATVAD